MRPEIIARVLGEGAADNADAGTIATATVDALRRLLAELKPVVGEMATSALYGRALHLARSSLQRPALVPPEPLGELLAGLHHDLAARTPAEAKQAGQAVLHSLANLLLSMIGEPLTCRMLRTAWGAPADELPRVEKPQ